MSKEINKQTIDLAKVISYLYNLKENNIYVTPEGLALLEGVVLSGNKKVKVIDYKYYDRLLNSYKKQIKKPWYVFW